MKRNLFLLIALLCVLEFKASAQITINQSDFAVTPYTSITGRDTSSFINPWLSGPNKTWDFSAFHPVTIDTAHSDPSNFTPNPIFPTANIAACSTFPYGSFCGYYNISSSALTVLGIDITITFANTTHQVDIFTPAEIVYPFPLNYTQTNNQAYIQNQLSVYTPPSAPDFYDSSRTVYHRSRELNVDGWGTLITQYGSYNALRVTEIDHNVDTTFNHVSGGSWSMGQVNAPSVDTTFTWLANGVFQVGSISKYSPTVHRYSFLKSSAATGIAEGSVREDGYSIYPNPAHEQLNIEVRDYKNALVEIYSMQGQLIQNIALDAQKASINIENLTVGIYFIKVKTAAGVAVQKFIKS